MIRQVVDQGRSAEAVATEFGISRRTLFKWISRYRSEGPEGLSDRSSAPHRIPRRYPEPTDEFRRVLFAALHAPPSDFGFNRTTWKMGDLVEVMRRREFATNQANIAKLIREAGYRWRKARVVLTSNDKRFREKLDRIRDILSHLEPSEAFFSVDEFGPFAIRLRGGRALAPPGATPKIPQWQKSKGALTMVAALELSGNQLLHSYIRKKNTDAMIRMLRMLTERYSDRKRIVVSWDAASWHRSQRLFDFIGQHNNGTRNLRPTIEVAPLPARAQFLNVIESVFSGMARAIIHNSNYPSVDAAKAAIDRYFAERNEHFLRNPKRAGNRIWGKERTPASFDEGSNCKDPRYR